MFEVTKDKEFIFVKATVTRRRYSKEPKIRVHWREALKKAEETFPDVSFKEIPDHKNTLSNSEQDNMTWKFEILEKAKNKKIKNTRRVREPVSKSDEEQNPFTNSEESATVEETSQSDQPAIVQEPTE